MKKVLFLFIAVLTISFVNARELSKSTKLEVLKNSQENLVRKKAAGDTKTSSPFVQSNMLKVAADETPIPEGYARITLTVGDVWGDGTGYQMLLDADANTYGSIIPETGSFTLSGDATTQYDEFEYKIPTNADGVLTTTNIVVNSSISIDIPAGTYDYCITNPTPEDRIWIASGELGRADDYVFHAGCNYNYAVTINSATGYDEVTLEILTNATIDAEVVAITAPASVGINLSNAEIVKTMIKNTGTSSITGFSLELKVNENVIAAETYTGTIDALSQAEYTFNATADLSAEGEHTIVITVNLENDEIDWNNSASIAILNAICNPVTSLPLTEDFETTSALCWTTSIGSATADNEMGATMEAANSGSISWFFSSYNESSDNNYDQYLISPELPITTAGTKTISFYYLNYLGSEGYQESFRVGYSASDNSVENFTWFDEVIDNSSTDWVLHTEENIPADAKYIAIHYTSIYSYFLFIDDITISEKTVSSINSNTDNSISVYPNPSNGEFNVTVADKSVVKVIDLTGRILEAHNVKAGATLNLSQTTGVYLIQVESNGEINTQKLIVK